ncbi:hypothetical protein ACIQU6_43160 [Streptomyces sp. NPDC090442]|uniref:hypothetical protein n=1 Tax=Streptomyces sp. NPDC090442 TaxID=3365962 RepID=UPI00380B0AF3
MHPIRELAAVIHPMPEPGSVTPQECFGDACDQVERERQQCADHLQAVFLGTEEDPLILALQQAQEQREAAEQLIRRLLAYAREFKPRRSYSLGKLAGPSGYTPSGVRSAYTSTEVDLIQEQINRAPLHTVNGKEQA